MEPAVALKGKETVSMCERVAVRQECVCRSGPSQTCFVSSQTFEHQSYLCCAHGDPCLGVVVTGNNCYGQARRFLVPSSPIRCLTLVYIRLKEYSLPYSSLVFVVESTTRQTRHFRLAQLHWRAASIHSVSVSY